MASISPNAAVIGSMPLEYKGYAERHEPRLNPEDLMNVSCEDIVEIAKDKWKSRSLQRSLMEHDVGMTELIYEKALPVFDKLLNDQYGNYLSQKILEHCSDSQFNQVFDSIKKDFFTLANEVHGTRAVQKFVEEAVRRNRTDAIVEVLAPNLEPLSRSITGFHVIVKLLEKLPIAKCEDILAVLCKDAESVVALGVDQWGCCVLKTCVDTAQGARAELINEAIIESSLRLIQDAYGNYVVQHLLQSDTKQLVLPRMIEKLKDHMLELCQQKFSSNVLEKLLTTANEKHCLTLINSIIYPQVKLESSEEGKENEVEGNGETKRITEPTMKTSEEIIETLLFHQYGNYVLQQLLCVAKDPMYSQIVDKVRPFVHEVLRTSYQHGGVDIKNSFPKKNAAGLAAEQAQRLALKLVKRFPTLIEGLEDNIRHAIMSPNQNSWNNYDWNGGQYGWDNAANNMYGGGGGAGGGYGASMWDTGYYWPTPVKYPMNQHAGSFAHTPHAGFHNQVNTFHNNGFGSQHGNNQNLGMGMNQGSGKMKRKQQHHQLHQQQQQQQQQQHQQMQPQVIPPPPAAPPVTPYMNQVTSSPSGEENKDGQVVGRVVGYWPHYTIAYDQEPTAA